MMQLEKNVIWRWGRRGRILAAAALAVLFVYVGFHMMKPPDHDSDKDFSSAQKEAEQTILIWEYDRGTKSFREALSALAGKASKESINGKNYQVVAVAVPEETYDQEVLEAYVQGRAPDIVLGNPEAFSFHTGIGVVIDLNPILQRWEEEECAYLDEVPSLAWSLFRNGRTQVGIPATQTGYGLIYNRTIFEQAGIGELPANYEEWDLACEKISALGIIPWINGTEKTGIPSLACLTYWLGTNCASVLDGKKGIRLDNPACQEVWEFYERNYQKHYQPENVLQYTEEQARELFLSGRAAMYAGGIPTFLPEECGQYGVLPMVCGSMSLDSPNHPVSYQGYYGIRSNHSKDTLEVLKWWYEHQDELWTGGDADRVSCIQETADRVYGESPFFREWMQENLFAEKVTTIFYPETNYPVYANELLSSGYLTDVLLGVYSGGTIQDGVWKASYEIDHLLEKYIIS